MSKRGGSTTRSAASQLARRQATKARRQPWYRAYKARILSGLEHCRNCGAGGVDLTFGHLIPASVGTPTRMATVTILCLPCNQEQGTEFWELPSLASEEHDAPPEKRWGNLAHVASMAERAAARESSVPGGMVAR